MHDTLSAMKSQRRTLGAIVEVPLGGDWHAYAQVLHEPEVAFFDARSQSDIPVDEIVSQPVLFRLWVMNRALTSGRWPKVGKADIPDTLLQPVPRFKQDPLNPDVLTIYLDGGSERPATRVECMKLERAAVWSAEHVEDRLRDHYLGRPNKWVESLSLKRGI